VHGMGFNVSHSEDVALLALSSESKIELGIDVECAARRPRNGETAEQMDKRAMNLARRFFTQNEVKQLERVTQGASREAAFLRAWTLKEACVKATGKGIAGSLRSFEIDFGIGSSADLQSTGVNPQLPKVSAVDGSKSAALAWNVTTFSAGKGAPAALAVSSSFLGSPTAREIAVRREHFQCDLGRLFLTGANDEAAASEVD